eukprot:TRINITY_DN1338_c0_g1_i1.p1 TRINITY_DN1338_c0_g1~~TRINITY_DN1338_c0_g1_i1.p1  ORF type:complete len:295 (-),score=28.08 TRINITY_DN1338_c0_g1_i1:257-1141(-)
METRQVEITVISARGLKKSNLFSKMKAYAVVTLRGALGDGRQRTAIDKENTTDPNWNHLLKFIVNESDLQQGRLFLDVVIFSEGTLGDKEVAQVTIPLKDFASKPGTAEFASYQLRKPSGKPKGTLNVSIKISEKNDSAQNQGFPAIAGASASKGESTAADASSKDQPATAYPAYGGASASKDQPATAYPAYPPNGYPAYNGYPPHTGYPAQSYPNYQGYPPQGYPPQGYYAPQQQQQQPPKKKKNKFGMGLGAGLLGGALGGLLIGDLVSDAASYDAGYDAGFDDGFGDGFDF